MHKDAATTEANGLWYAVHTRSRHEFAVSQRLTRSGIRAFLPTVERMSQWKDRRKLVEFPLFSGYLFVNLGGTPQEFVSVVKVPGVVNILGNAGFKPVPVPDIQVASLMKIVESKEQFDPYPYLGEGKAVKIIRGPFEGIQGILVRREGYHRLVVSVDLLQRAVSIKIDAMDVAPF